MPIGPLHAIQNRHLASETCNCGVGKRQKRPPRTRSGRCMDPNTEKSYPPGIGTRLIIPESAGRQGTARPARKPPSCPRGSHTRRDAPHGRQSSNFCNQPVPDVRRPVQSPDSGCQLRLEPPLRSVRRPAGPGSRPRRILNASCSGLADPTEPAGYTQPGRFKAARRRGVSPGRLSLRRTRVAATIHHPAAQAAGGNRRSPERTEKSYPPGLKASICEAPGVRGRTPGALGRPHLPTRIARTRGGSRAAVDFSLISSSAPVHQNTNPKQTNPKQTNTVIESIQTLQLASGISPRTGAFQRGPNDHAERYAAPSPTVPACCNPLRIRELRPNRPINKHPADTRLRVSAGGDEPAFRQRPTQRLTPGPRDRPAW